MTNNFQPNLQNYELSKDAPSETHEDSQNIYNQVQVGVGGLFIMTAKCDGTEKECALLYKRYKAPEIYQWSLLGGHVGMFETCEDTLKKKASRILQIPEREIEVHDVIVAANHYDEANGFHFVSPQYYIKIRFEAHSLSTVDTMSKAKGTKKIVILHSKRQLKESMKEKYNDYTSLDKPLLALIPIELIQHLEADIREKTFIHTTIEAVNGHYKLQNRLKQINSALEQYKSWRTLT